MANTPRTQTKPNEPQAIVEVGGDAFLLPVDDAIMVAKLLHRGLQLSRDWSAAGGSYWMFRTGSKTDINLKFIDDTDLAKINLSSG